METGTNHSAKYYISKGIDQFFIGTYEIFRFILQFFKEVFTPPYEFREVIKQCYQIGYKSLPLISLTGFIVGIVFTDHSRPSLASFGAIISCSGAFSEKGRKEHKPASAITVGTFNECILHSKPG